MVGKSMIHHKLYLKIVVNYHLTTMFVIA